MIFNITGGGGTALNFRVVGGTTAPANPQENTIWVNTGVDITGWEFSSVRPSSPENGMVWFTTGTSSTVAFNALRKNKLQIYPVSAEQYVGGLWESVPVKSCQGGAWVEWRVGYVFKDGEYGEISGFICERATATLSNKILTFTGNGNVFSNAYSEERINLSGINSIIVTIESGSQGYNAFYGVMSTIPSQNTGSGQISGLDVVETIHGGNAMQSFSGTFSLDVSGLSGEHYLVFNFGGTSSGNAILKISGITYG